MVKLTLPLGSGEAHGKLGTDIIFQGNTAKVWRAPVIRKVQAQLDAQDKFRDATRMIYKMGLWGRGTLQTVFGMRWFSGIFKEITQQWEAAEIDWVDVSEENKVAWTSNAPAIDGVLECGKVFYICAYALDAAFTRSGKVESFRVPFGDGEAEGTRMFWDWTLDGVFLPGTYDDIHEDLNFSINAGDWTTETNAAAYGGSYHLSHAAQDAYVIFYFYGLRFGLLHHQSPDAGAAEVIVDYRAPEAFSMNDPSGLFQVEWMSANYGNGLHEAFIRRVGAEGSINIDGIVIYG